MSQTQPTVVGRADEVGLLPEGELRDTLVPALDHTADTLGKSATTLRPTASPRTGGGQCTM
jgi:hypothetical protein